MYRFRPAQTGSTSVVPWTVRKVLDKTPSFVHKLYLHHVFYPSLTHTCGLPPGPVPTTPLSSKTRVLRTSEEAIGVETETRVTTLRSGDLKGPDFLSPQSNFCQSVEYLP